MQKVLRMMERVKKRNAPAFGNRWSKSTKKNIRTHLPGRRSIRHHEDLGAIIPGGRMQAFLLDQDEEESVKHEQSIAIDGLRHEWREEKKKAQK
jgi:hypothetical protein